MGMAASQARFLQLTARKTNVEYMGQQINQERLALANQSAGLFEKMLTMEPPVPPSSLDDKYFTQGYTFTDANDGIGKKISWQTMDEVVAAGSLADGTVVTAGSEAFAVSFDYYEAATGIPSAILDAPDGSTLDSGGDAIWVESADSATVDASSATIAGASHTAGSVLMSYQDFADMDTQAEVDAFMTSFGISPTEGASKQVIRFVTVEHSIYDPDGNYTTIQEQSPALLEFDNLERLVNVILLNEDAGATGSNSTFGSGVDVSLVSGTGAAGTSLAGTSPADNAATSSDDLYASYDWSSGVNGSHAGGLAAVDNLDDFSSATLANSSAVTVGQGESLTYSGVFDETSFNDDMNRYEFNKAAYDYQIERINLETAKIQKQDKSLELKMKQLDTEHRAIQTELDAVQKVIQKNIESSFKTFA